MGNESFGREQARRLQKDIDKYAEADDEDYEDVFGKANGTSSHPMQTLQLNTRLSNKSWVSQVPLTWFSFRLVTNLDHSSVMMMTTKIRSRRYDELSCDI